MFILYYLLYLLSCCYYDGWLSTGGRNNRLFSRLTAQSFFSYSSGLVCHIYSPDCLDWAKQSLTKNQTKKRILLETKLFLLIKGGDPTTTKP